MDNAIIPFIINTFFSFFVVKSAIELLILVIICQNLSPNTLQQPFLSFPFAAALVFALPKAPSPKC